MATTPHGGSRLFGRMLWVASACIIALLTLTPASPGPQPGWMCLVCGTTGGTDAVLNVLLFIPLGMGLALDEIQPARAIAGMCLASVAIEALQLGVIPNRDATVGDVVMNSFGGMIGFAAGWHLGRIVRPDPRFAARLVIGWSVVWLGVQLVSGLAYVPALPVTRYFGQIAHASGNRFDGLVVNPALDGLPIYDRRLDQTEAMRLALMSDSGARFTAIVVAKSCAEDLTPIVRVAAIGNAAVVNVSQTGAGFAYGIRTLAEVLRFRRVRFRLAHVFDASCTRGAAPDTVAMSARYSRMGAQLATRSRSAALGLSCQPRLSQGWRLVMPVQTYDECSPLDTGLGAVWIAILIIPGVYWACRARGERSRRPPQVAALGVCSAVLAFGFLVIPVLLRLPPAPWTDWVALVGGVLGAVVLARVSALHQPHTARS